LNQK